MFSMSAGFSLHRLVLTTGLMLVLLCASSLASASPITIHNAGFQQPDVASHQYNPNLASQGGLGWIFAGSSGVAENGGGFSVTGAVDGQAAFLQMESGHISQSLAFGAGSYTLTFISEGRPGYGSNPFNVFIDATLLAFSGNTIVTPTEGTFQAFTSDPFSVAAGAHTLAFDGLGVPDVTSFIDSVAFNEVAAVPEPASFLFVGTGILGLRLLRRRLSSERSG